MIACVLIRHFVAAIERRTDPTLGERPLIIGEPAGKSAKVYAVSPEAGQAGVRPGMTLRQAETLCPQGRLISATPRRYQDAFAELLETLLPFALLVEASDWQPAATSFLDLGDSQETEYIETIQQIGHALREQVHLTPAIGLAGGKFPACAAALLAEANEACCLAAGVEAAFLAPLPVDLLPLEAEVARWLKLLGIRTLGQLAALPVGAVQAQLGSQGCLLHRLAQGRDDRPLVPYSPQRIERVARQFDEPVTDLSYLQGALRDMAAMLAGRLRADGLASRELRMILHLEDGSQQEDRLILRQPAASAAHIAHAADELLAQMPLSSGVVQLEVTLTGLLPARRQQLDLFSPGPGQEDQLRDTIKDLVARYGVDSFYRISLLDPEARLPERRFQLQEADTL